MKDFKRTRVVLIVEDDLASKLVLARLFALMEPSTRISWASTAEEAERILEERTYSLVISDMFLEGPRTGMDLWESCRRTQPAMPFVLISAYLPAKAPRAVPFVRKPLGPENWAAFRVAEGTAADIK